LTQGFHTIEKKDFLSEKCHLRDIDLPDTKAKKTILGLESEGCGFEPWHLLATFYPGLPLMRKFARRTLKGYKKYNKDQLKCKSFELRVF